mmetsp:Transcript_26830/g.60745  ORF Transcript_26830/g.60745 Transcript_26830/m.60745 type:complete len:602 (-) Transcript_26830:3956-5761(-)
MDDGRDQRQLQLHPVQRVRHPRGLLLPGLRALGSSRAQPGVLALLVVQLRGRVGGVPGLLQDGGFRQGVLDQRLRRLHRAGLRPVDAEVLRGQSLGGLLDLEQILVRRVGGHLGRQQQRLLAVRAGDQIIQVGVDRDFLAVEGAESSAQHGDRVAAQQRPELFALRRGEDRQRAELVLCALRGVLDRAHLLGRPGLRLPQMPHLRLRVRGRQPHVLALLDRTEVFLPIVEGDSKVFGRRGRCQGRVLLLALALLLLLPSLLLQLRACEAGLGQARLGLVAVLARLEGLQTQRRPLLIRRNLNRAGPDTLPGPEDLRGPQDRRLRPQIADRGDLRQRSRRGVHAGHVLRIDAVQERGQLQRHLRGLALRAPQGRVAAVRLVGVDLAQQACRERGYIARPQEQFLLLLGVALGAAQLGFLLLAAGGRRDQIAGLLPHVHSCLLHDPLHSAHISNPRSAHQASLREGPLLPRYCGGLLPVRGLGSGRPRPVYVGLLRVALGVRLRDIGVDRLDGLHVLRVLRQPPALRAQPSLDLGVPVQDLLHLLAHRLRQPVGRGVLVRSLGAADLRRGQLVVLLSGPQQRGAQLLPPVYEVGALNQKVSGG